MAKSSEAQKRSRPQAVKHPGLFMTRPALIFAACLASLAWALAPAAEGPARPGPGARQPPASAPAGRVSNLDLWLQSAAPATRAAAVDPRTGGANPFDAKQEAGREDAPPGVIELSDGRQLPGLLYTTREKNWEVWEEKDPNGNKVERWRRIPFIAVLSITAVVEETGMEQEWRWKEMGQPERVYTGREYPTIRLSWVLHLIDGSTVRGSIKGQPVWVDLNGKSYGPYVLYERAKGQMGQKVSDIVYPRQIVVSRRMMEEVLKSGPPASQPAAMANTTAGTAVVLTGKP